MIGNSTRKHIKETRSIATQQLHPGPVRSSFKKSNFIKYMYTLQNSTNKEMNGKNEKFIGNEAVLLQQFEIINSFFQTDSGSEMICSLHTMIESFLFTENLSQVTPEMREHIVNQLRVATLVAKLEKSYNGLKEGPFEV